MWYVWGLRVGESACAHWCVWYMSTHRHEDWREGAPENVTNNQVS